jgi:hypothetical protein
MDHGRDKLIIPGLMRMFLAAVCMLGCCRLSVYAQENVTTVGVQIKPMITSKYFGAGTENFEEGDLRIGFEPNLGWNFGMVIRRGFTKNWSFETGICFVQRNYTMSFDYPELRETKRMKFRYIGYEIPLQALVFVKLSDQLFMNASAGVSIDLYPSNIETSDFEYIDTLRFDFYQKTFKKNWIQTAILANYGFEYRTRNDGYFYAGISYHRPFSHIGITRINMERNTVPNRAEVLLGGNYLTLDLRYFFHEKPERAKPKEK